MQTGEIYGALTSVFHDIFDDEEIVLRPETTATDIPDWDSFNHINIIVAVETRFGIKFQTTEIESLKNVGDLVAAIEHKLAARAKVRV
ncbi:MAG: acyl carrier protein [Acetobacteraceae bacterium]|nr:acyl carrier protein [Acetobacteraceae bacterium]